MRFKDFNDLLSENVKRIYSDSSVLFLADVSKEDLWNLYLEAFPAGENEIYRERRYYDCSACRNFIKNAGNLVAIVDYKPVSIWRFDTGSEVFQPVVDALADMVESAPIRDVFLSPTRHIGQKESHELQGDEVRTWSHLYLRLPKWVLPPQGVSIPSVQGARRDSKNVLKRSCEEITTEAIETVLELISQKSLYRGDEWEQAVSDFLVIHNSYHQLLTKSDQDNFCWIESIIHPGVSRIRNHSIGTLLTDLSEGMDLDMAVTRWEVVMAPSNYKRPKAIFTRSMVDAAEKAVNELGLDLNRRHARVDDLTVNNVLFVDRSVGVNAEGGLFAGLRNDIVETPHKFDRVEEIHIDDFSKNILPTLQSLEILVENRHEANLMSLIAPVSASSSPLFKWDNLFSWVYKGSVADSMKQRVLAAGGKVDGDLRFSLQWNENRDNPNDFDAHCKEPNGNHIYYSNPGPSRVTRGGLDVDVVHPVKDIAVENIIWGDIQNMIPGEYKFWVRNFTDRGGTSGFRAEIEFDGNIYEYDYQNYIPQSKDVAVAQVTLSEGKFKINHSIPVGTRSKKIWGLATNKFHRVKMHLLSPNHWDGAVGNKHFLFILDGCEADERLNGFFNEQLRNDLMIHKRVFEALSGRTAVASGGEQLSGLGFNSTTRNNVIIRFKTKNMKRVMKLVF